jgi:hypothetical protein
LNFLLVFFFFEDLRLTLYGFHCFLPLPTITISSTLIFIFFIILQYLKYFHTWCMVFPSVKYVLLIHVHMIGHRKSTAKSIVPHTVKSLFHYLQAFSMTVKAPSYSIFHILFPLFGSHCGVFISLEI